MRAAVVKVVAARAAVGELLMAYALAVAGGLAREPGACKVASFLWRNGKHFCSAE